MLSKERFPFALVLHSLVFVVNCKHKYIFYWIRLVFTSCSGPGLLLVPGMLTDKCQSYLLAMPYFVFPIGITLT